jgi:hypothetical protein
MRLPIRACYAVVASALVMLPACGGDGVTDPSAASIGLKVSGDRQIGNRGNALPVPIRVRATDSLGVPTRGVTVTFAVAAGGGSISPASMVTNDSGLAFANWVLGPTATTQSVNATVGTLAPLVFTASAIPSSGAGFQIYIANVGPAFHPAVQAAFDAAVTFWQGVITGDIANYPSHVIDAGSCSNGEELGPFNVDDIVILAQFDSIDGPGNILGQARPCWIRDNGFLTISGVMNFDSADVQSLINNGALNLVIKHEMAHVLGFGTLWATSLVDCLRNPSSNSVTQDTYYTCPQGRAAFDAIGGTTYVSGQKVPLENCDTASPPTCGAGTFNSHWREPVFHAELMTGYLQGNVPNPVSRVTIGAMEDLGYTVNYSAAEPYTDTFKAPQRRPAASIPMIDLGNDVSSGTIYIVDPAHRITGTARSRP